MSGAGSLGYNGVYTQMTGTDGVRNGAPQLVLTAKVVLYRLFLVTTSPITFQLSLFPDPASTLPHSVSLTCSVAMTWRGSQDETFGEPDASRIIFRDVDTRGQWERRSQSESFRL